MEMFNSIGLLLGGSWASGLNLYMSMAGLGIANRMDWIDLPENLDILSNPILISVAIFLYVIEFAADKIPYIDSLWDSVHTFIRPLATSALGYTAMADSGMILQLAIAFITGTISLESHLTKATTRAIINTSPEPVTNSIASVTEDASVAGILYLIMCHPVIAAALITIFIIISIWFLKKMFKFLKKVFDFSGREKFKDTALATENMSSGK
ncbi:MAG: DUF4126 domain-containing protein [Candidatus Scalindua rubra]|uniref:DUF4126 domain-containing protein n=1 Tax=Candidatus Scalindua brodae TaxID=237368 RepID=A0A0B0EPZ1_9BACT|nr:MAG: hypothetical protein SCABRO_00980 [Candidatus Scalindua brodae]MBZ0107920.1 DUF4126 domain-containing protein [Candidatus Scalindua rubra]TWU31036.1 hypothetical protein S225a_22580 [Candidatus Brocadiaceae bacterium S225]